MSNIVQLPTITYKNASDLIKQIAKDSSRVVMTVHCNARMVERGVTLAQVLRCLIRGMEKDVEFDNSTGCFKVTLEHRTAGVRLSVVAALEKDEKGGLVVAVTAFTNPI